MRLQVCLRKSSHTLAEKLPLPTKNKTRWSGISQETSFPFQAHGMNRLRLTCPVKPQLPWQTEWCMILCPVISSTGTTPNDLQTGFQVIFLFERFHTHSNKGLSLSATPYFYRIESILSSPSNRYRMVRPLSASTRMSSA